VDILSIKSILRGQIKCIALHIDTGCARFHCPQEALTRSSSEKPAFWQSYPWL
jgi:hypothetical protein